MSATMLHIKRVDTPVVQPEIRTTVTRFVCDIPDCKFSVDAKSEEVARKHYGSAHAIAEVRALWEDTWFKFNTADDLEAYLALGHHPVLGCRIICHHIRVAGWYHQEVLSEVDCDQGCCKERHEVLIPKAAYVGMMREKARAYELLALQIEAELP